MGFKEAKRQLIEGGSALRNHSMNQKTLRESLDNEGDGEYVSKKVRRSKTQKPRPDTPAAIEKRRVDRVVAAATNPRVAEILKGIILEDMDELGLVRQELMN